MNIRQQKAENEYINDVQTTAFKLTDLFDTYLVSCYIPNEIKCAVWLPAIFLNQCSENSKQIHITKSIQYFYYKLKIINIHNETLVFNNFTIASHPFHTHKSFHSHLFDFSFSFATLLAPESDISLGEQASTRRVESTVDIACQA